MRYNDIKLEKGMYICTFKQKNIIDTVSGPVYTSISNGGKSFTQTLEELDPSERYKDTPLEGLDAYQRQLKRFNIRVRGENSSRVEDFFLNSETAVLFPEYVARNVQAGMEEENILRSIVANVTRISGLDFRSFHAEATDDNKSERDLGMQTPISAKEIEYGSQGVRLMTRGRMLVASYEACRFQRLGHFSIMLRQIGAQIARMHIEDAVGVIENGDIKSNAAEKCSVGEHPIGGTYGNISYGALVDFCFQFNPYNMNVMLMNPVTAAKVIRCPEFANVFAWSGFINDYSTPLGAKLIATPAVDAGKIIGLDRHYALEMVSFSGVSVECDRLIERQFERSAITNTCGFAKLYKDASRILDIGSGA